MLVLLDLALAVAFGQQVDAVEDRAREAVDVAHDLPRTRGSPLRALEREIRCALCIWPVAECGSFTPTLRKTYMVKPEQSKPRGVEPPAR